MRWMSPILAPSLLVSLLGGCATGYNSTLFMTKSNIGLDIDSKPPTAEISIARREGVIAPGFEGGQTPPVLSSFRTRSNPFSRFFFGVQSTFAGGDAAAALAEGPGGPEVKRGPSICLSQKPDPKTFLGVDVSIPEKGEFEPFFFGTDTTLGLKVAWSGTTGQFPDTLRLGFSRKEFAWAPVFGTDATGCTVPGTDQTDGTYEVSMPPFLAVLDNDVQVGTPADTGVKWLQYFATGTAATTLANNNAIRAVMLERIDPEAFNILFPERSKDFFEKSRQVRVQTILVRIDDLTGKQAIELEKDVPVTTPEIEQAVAARDPDSQRLTDQTGDLAKQILKMRVVMSPRTDQDLEKWEEDIGKVIEPNS